MVKKGMVISKRHVRQNLIGWCFILPSLIASALFMFLPILFGFWYSLTDYTGLSGDYNFIGFANYVKMFQDRYFKVSIKNNCIYAVWYSVLTMFVSLLLASLLNRLSRCRKFFRIAFFLPYISSMVSVAIIWKMIFNPQGGPLNTVLAQLGVSEPPQWLASTTWALYAVIIVSVWKNAGYYMMIFLAGLQNVPDSLYEAAALDGAGGWQKYFRITLPLISPTIFLNMILVTISSFQVFDLISVMTDGGPGMSTNVLAFRIYQEGFRQMHMGYASAIAYFLFAIILGITLVQFAVQKYWVNYD